ncbi:uncharacterized protein [Onthophagus taurus]|uniref:uncharacterized protein isoform X2 n=1 Tax=Onthophagus taurus TaxID=166361 RepID=UPI0039BDEB81
MGDVHHVAPRSVCNNGQTYSDEEKQCHCQCVKYQWNCGPKAFIPTTPKPAPLCEPGTEFKYGCNWCFCSSVGTPTYCTSMPC